MLVGNKCDLRHLRAVPTEEAKAYAGSYTIKMEKLKTKFVLCCAMVSIIYKAGCLLKTLSISIWPFHLIPYSGKFSLVQNFAELPPSPSEENFVVLNFALALW